MARVIYSAEINELKGSVGGTTFQRNKSGTISKLKSHLTYNPSSGQLISRSVLASLTRLWHSLSMSNQLSWNSFAAAHTKYSYWNVEKNLSGFNWFVHVNSNRLACGQSYSATPPSYATPLFCPTFFTLINNDGIGFSFDSFPERDSYYLFVFATPPIRQVNLQSRRSLRLIAVIDPDNLTIYDLTSAYEVAFNLSWPPASVSNSFNVLLAISCIDKNTFIAGQFYLDNYFFNADITPSLFADSYNAYTSPGKTLIVQGYGYTELGICFFCDNPNNKLFRSSDYAANWSDLGSILSTSSVRAPIVVSEGVYLAGTSSPGYIIRSTDYGLTWTNVFSYAGESQFFSLAYLGNGVCLATSAQNGLIFRSTDYGLNWTQITNPVTVQVIYSICVCGSGIIVLGTDTSGQILRSTDNGLSFSVVTPAYGQTYIYEMTYCGNGVILAATYPNGDIFKSTDYGVTWSVVFTISTGNRVVNIMYCGFGVVLATSGTPSKVWRSTDYGATWSILASPYPSANYCFIALINSSIALLASFQYTNAGTFDLR